MSIFLRRTKIEIANSYETDGVSKKDKESETAIFKIHGAEMDSGKELRPKREYEEIFPTTISEIEAAILPYPSILPSPLLSFPSLHLSPNLSNFFRSHINGYSVFIPP